MEKEIISKFKEKPKTATGWRTMYLGLAALLISPFLGIFTAVIRPIIDKESVNGENTRMAMGFGPSILAFVLSILAFITGVNALRKGERSWILWMGFIPAILIGAFWTFMIAGELLFPH